MSRRSITGVVLAGGRATRWGGRDKGLIEVCGRPMISHVLDALRPQVDHVLINANRNLERYRGFGCPVVSDAGNEFLGPLAGIASGMAAASTDWIAVVPCDSPLLAADCVARLDATLDENEAIDIAVAHDGKRIQPVFALIRRGLHRSLAAFLESGGRKIDQWYAQERMQLVDLSDIPETFENINRPEDRDRIEACIRNRTEPSGHRDMTDDDLLELFQARRGVICAVGAGGKKSTLYALVARHPGRVALTATVFTTHFPTHLGLHSVIADEAELPARLAPLAEAKRLGFAAPSEKPGRYSGITPELVSRLHAETAREVTFVKADGARMRWMKAPRDGEPVLPPDCSTLICVLSAKALGRPLSDEIAHRLPQIRNVTGLEARELVEPKHFADLLVSDAGLLRGSAGRVVVPVINMVDDAHHERLARQAAEIALAGTDRFDRVILASMRRDDQPVVAVIER